LPAISRVKEFGTRECEMAGLVLVGAAFILGAISFPSPRGHPLATPSYAPDTVASDSIHLKRTWLPTAAMIAFPLKLTTVILIAVLSYQSLTQRGELAQKMLTTMEVSRQVEALMSVLKDAETGQRGYLLTSDESYLAP